MIVAQNILAPTTNPALPLRTDWMIRKGVAEIAKIRPIPWLTPFDISSFVD